MGDEYCPSEPDQGMYELPSSRHPGSLARISTPLSGVGRLETLDFSRTRRRSQQLQQLLAHLLDMRFSRAVIGSVGGGVGSVGGGVRGGGSGGGVGVGGDSGRSPFLVSDSLACKTPLIERNHLYNSLLAIFTRELADIL